MVVVAAAAADGLHSLSVRKRLKDAFGGCIPDCGVIDEGCNSITGLADSPVADSAGCGALKLRV